MVNDKKIEEAARYYCNNRYPASQDAPFIAEGFRHGAKWMREEFLKDLWHPIEKEPKEGFDLVYINKAKEFREISSYNSDRFDDLFGNRWGAACRRFGIYKWAYKDNLLLREGGEQ